MFNRTSNDTRRLSALSGPSFRWRFWPSILFKPQNFRATPEDLFSLVVEEVWVGLYDANGGSADASWDARIAEMTVEYDNQSGANDCLYWTGNHLAGRYPNEIISSNSAKEDPENPLEIRQRVV